MKCWRNALTGALFLMLSGLVSALHAAAPEPLFEFLGPRQTDALPEHVAAARAARINPRAFQAAAVEIRLDGESMTALRTRVERSQGGQITWVGHAAGHPADTVVLVRRNGVHSGLIQRGDTSYRLGVGRTGRGRLFELDLESLPGDDAAALPDLAGSNTLDADASTALESNASQDLLVVYTQPACRYVNGCEQLEADIVTAVADMNTAYAESGIGIAMRLAGMARTDYSGTDARQALEDLRGSSDGRMDEIHQLRDALGADIVSLVYDGQGCGLAYLAASAPYAFNVTDVPCLVGNRSMAHEIAHNQGAHHDRESVGGGISGAYHYGYRRCDGGATDQSDAPHFRTVLAYPCGSSPRVGRFSHPLIDYEGVPQGVDPELEPERGAYNAFTLNESAAYVAAFRGSSASSPPAPPGDLVAVAGGSESIALEWLDHADNEDRFSLQRTRDGIYSTIAILEADTTTFRDGGLFPETRYEYRVRAENSAGSSAWSVPASAATEPATPSIEDLALGDVALEGLVSGSYRDTHAVDGISQAIEERHSGGPRKSRHQRYAHAWNFDVFGGSGGVVFSAEAWVSGAEAARFFYSLDGGGSVWPMFTVTDTRPGTRKSFLLPAATSGPVRIEIHDTERSSGESTDVVFVDQLLISSYADSGDPPNPPSDLRVAEATDTTITLHFTDRSDNESGFEIRRGDGEAGGCGDGTAVNSIDSEPLSGATVEYVDQGLSPASTYWYRVSAFNAAGDGGCSNTASATTGTASARTLHVTAYKLKGVQHARLEWSGLNGDTADLRRDGSLVAAVANDGLYIDDIGVKGGGSYAYRLCQAGSLTACTPEQRAEF